MVDFPFDPVIATTFGATSKVCHSGVPKEQKNNPISLSNGIPNRIASAITKCGLGYKCGIPGEVIISSSPSSPSRIGSMHRKPFSSAAKRPASSSSQQKTFAPPANNAFAEATPEHPIPKTKTDLFCTPWTGIIFDNSKTGHQLNH